MIRREPEARRVVGAFTQLPEIIREAGGDPEQILGDSGLAPEMLEQPTNFVPYEALLRTLNLAASRSGCPHLGLAAGQCWRLADLGLLGEIMRHSPTAGDALQELVRHQHINADGTLAFMVQRHVMIDLGYAAYVRFEASVAPLYDAVMAATINFMRELCGSQWSPAMVLLPHAAPPDISAYHRVFGAPVRFDSDVCSMRFHSSWLLRPAPGADPSRLRAAKVRAAALDDRSATTLAQRTLRTLLIHGKPSGADVAQALALHRRTLNRRLAAEGTTFQKVLDQVRSVVARELLQDSSLSMSQISATLGYEEETAFFRSFRRWTGSSPGAWREALVKAGG